MYSIELPEISKDTYAQFYAWFSTHVTNAFNLDRSCWHVENIGKSIDLDYPTPFSVVATVLGVTQKEGIAIINWFEENTGDIISF